MPYDITELGQHWLNEWFVARLHQAITLASVDLLKMIFCVITTGNTQDFNDYVEYAAKLPNWAKVNSPFAKMLTTQHMII